MALLEVDELTLQYTLEQRLVKIGTRLILHQSDDWYHQLLIHVSGHNHDPIYEKSFE